jgi:hypothetical protein
MTGPDARRQRAYPVGAGKDLACRPGLRNDDGRNTGGIRGTECQTFAMSAGSSSQSLQQM